MFCRRCGAQVPDDSTFCTRCGTPVALTGVPGNPPTESGQFPPTLPGEQFTPPPVWQGPPPPSGWTYPGGPGPYRPPSPLRPPLLEQPFGARPQPGTPLNHRSRIQRGLFSRLQPSFASSAWFGAIIGSLFAFVLVLLLSVAFSLTLGSTLDQGSFGTGSILSSSGLSSSNSFSFYSNPLQLLTYAHRSTFDLKLSANGSPSDNTVALVSSISASVTPPLTLLLLIPAIGLIFGGYLAASTNYGSRRLFSVTRGASISVLYALLVLIISLVASATITLPSGDTSLNVSLTPQALSAFFNALLWGLVFGALGGYLHSRSLPKAAPTRPRSRAAARIRGALAGTGIALVILFTLCLIVVVGLYILAQAGGPALRTQGSPSALTGPAGGNCSIFLQQPDPAAPTPAILPNTLATHISFAIESPSLALWVMPLSMGAPLAISGSGTSINIGLFASDCGPGTEGAVFYFLLLLPAVAIFVGGWFAARAAQARTDGEAAAVGLLMAVAITLFLLIATFLTSISISIGLGGIASTVTAAPSITGVLLAGLIGGAVFGTLGSIVGRPRNLPHLQHSAPSAWPATPAGWPGTQGAWPSTPQGPAQPTVSSAVTSYPPASAGPDFAVLGDQPAVVTPDLPQIPSAPGRDGEAANPEDSTPQTS